MRTVIINSSNSNPIKPSEFTYPFPTSGAQFTDGDQVAVSSISLYYSWFNITDEKKNNVFQYRWYHATGSVLRTVTIPDGFYTAGDLNEYLQSVMISNGDYTTNSSGDNIYFGQISENPTAYAIQLDCFVIPDPATATGLGYTLPPNGLGWPVASSTFEFVILSNAFQNIIGFNAGTYPPAPLSVVYSAISNFTPQVSPVNTILLSCSLCNNQYSDPSNIIFAFSPSGQFGESLIPSINSLVWNQIQRGTYQNCVIEFLDQNYNPIKLNDVNLVVQLVFRNVKTQEVS